MTLNEKDIAYYHGRRYKDSNPVVKPDDYFAQANAKQKWT